jgi:hypothetical protein
MWLGLGYLSLETTESMGRGAEVRKLRNWRKNQKLGNKVPFV